MAEYDDSLEARIPTDCPDNVRQVLLHAWSRDLTTLKELLNRPGAATEQDPKTGETPLHAVVRGCGPFEENEEEQGAEAAEDDTEDGLVAEARACIQELFFSGAIWNDVDNHNETPGCTAWRLGQKQLYQMFVDAGVRAELLFGLMDGYEKLSSGEDDEELGDAEIQEGQERGEEVTEGKDEEKGDVAQPQDAGAEAQAQAAQFVAPDAGEKPVTSDAYLQSAVTYDGDKLLDDDLNGVMMAWEADIMRRSVDALLPGAGPGQRILNIGFGMGIVDGLFAARQPARHHIVEAHPGVLAHVAGHPDSKFGAGWEASGPEEGAFKLHAGRWQEVVPRLAERGELYDAIYFDTFGEDYAELRRFFTEYVPVLLDMDGRFSFFNGLGADRRICYDVYSHVVELHTSEAGLDIEWQDLDVDMSRLNQDGKGEWQGVRRRYWTLDTYKLPVCTFMG